MQNSRYGEPTVFSTSQRVGTPNSHIVQGSNEFVHCFSVIQLCLSFCDPMNCSTPVFPVLHYLPSFLKLMSIESVMPSNHLILCHPLLLLSILLSIRVFSNQLALPIKWPKYWSFSQASALPMNTQGWFPLGLTDLISLLSKGLSRVFFSTIHNLKASIIRSSAFFMVQLSHSYMTTGKTTALTIWMFDGKVMSLLFNTLSSFVIPFLQRSKDLLILYYIY